MVIDFSSLYGFPRIMDRMFDDVWRPAAGEGRSLTSPPVNISEDEEAVRVCVELPGVDTADIELTLTEKSLVLRGERKAENGKYFRQERLAGPFQRIINFNLPINREEVSAESKDGLLVIILPKAESVQPKKIGINVS
jgi:HSP20 family protein